MSLFRPLFPYSLSRLLAIRHCLSSSTARNAQFVTFVDPSALSPGRGNVVSSFILSARLSPRLNSSRPEVSLYPEHMKCVLKTVAYSSHVMFPCSINRIVSMASCLPLISPNCCVISLAKAFQLANRRPGMGMMAVGFAKLCVLAASISSSRERIWERMASAQVVA